MSKKDNQEIDPVESIEDVVLNAITELEPTEEETEEPEVDPEETEQEESEGSEDEQETEQDSDDTDSESDAEPETGESEGDNDPDQEPDEEEQKLEAPEHWAAKDKELFNKQSKESQEFLLDRHKSMEGDYTRKSQEFAQERRQYDEIKNVLSPYEQEFAQAGLDHVGAVRQLASWHNALKSGGKESVLQLAKMYGIDMAEPEGDQEYIDPQVKSVQQELALLKQEQARNTQAAQQEKQKQLYDVIHAFESEKDESGALVHPHFETLKDDITKLFQAGIASDLNDGYTKALSMRPDLAVVKPQPAKITPTKTDQAAKVKKAKKAATGVKSSGAVGKINRDKMTLEQEIASHFQ